MHQISRPLALQNSVLHLFGDARDVRYVPVATRGVRQLLALPAPPAQPLLLPKLNMCCLLKSTCEWNSGDKLNGRSSGDYVLIKLLLT